MKTRSKWLVHLLLDDHLSLYEDYAKQHHLFGKSIHVLVIIMRNPQGICQKEICEVLNMTKQSLNATVKTFLNKGYIYLECNEKDKRNKLIKFTEEGKKYAHDIVDPLIRAELKALEHMSFEDQVHLLSLVKRYVNSFKKELKSNN